MKKIILPSLLDIEKIRYISNNTYIDSNTNKFIPYKFELKRLNIESIHYILYLIFRSTILKLNVLNEKEKSKYLNNGKLCMNDFYIELPSTILAKIDRDYNHIMYFLTNKHLNYDNILFRKKYEKGKSFSYCINYNLINANFQLIDVYKKSVLKHMNQVNQPKISGSIINRELLSLKSDFQNKFNIEFNCLSTELNNLKLILEYNSILSLLDYHNGKRWMSLSSEKDGRLHTNFTTMSSKYRKLIRNSKNDEFIEVDVGACIPFLFIMSIFKSSDFQITLHNNNHLKDYQILFNILNDKFSKLKTIELLGSELKELLHAILNDQFYQLFPSLSKMEILSFFFCKNNSKPLIEKKIKDAFPNFFYYVQTMKSNEFWVEHYKYPPKYDCNKLLSHFLFHLESTIMLYNVAKKVKKSIKGINIITVHDCLMVPKQNAEEVRSIMRDEFTKILILSPIIKLKGLS